MVGHYVQKGISLIELMITIAILAILVVMGTALTTQWSKQAELDKAVWSLQSAIDRARAEALRNEFAIDQWQGTVTSQLCWDSTTQQLTIHQATSSGAASCLTPIVFSYQLANTVTIKQLDDSAFTCLAFDDRAQPIDGAAQNISGSTNCSTSLGLKMSNGGLNETPTFN